MAAHVAPSSRLTGEMLLLTFLSHVPPTRYPRTSRYRAGIHHVLGSRALTHVFPVELVREREREDGPAPWSADVLVVVDDDGHVVPLLELDVPNLPSHFFFIPYVNM